MPKKNLNSIRNVELQEKFNNAQLVWGNVLKFLIHTIL